MNVQFMSRQLAKILIESGRIYDYDLISISDTNKEKKEIRKLWLEHKENDSAAIFLNFADDIECSNFTEEKANSICKFANESFNKNKDILVHCYAGISRSAAIAKFINEHYKLNDQYLSEYQSHNLGIYYGLLESAGVETLRTYYKSMDSNN